MKKTLLFILLACISGTTFAQISHGGNPISFQKKQLLSRHVETVTMPSFDQSALDAEDALNDQHKDIPWRFGYNHIVNINPDNSGNWEDLGRGSKIWRVRLESPNALTINLTFDRYYLPEGAQLFIYNDDKSEVLGALTHENNKATKDLGTTLLSGDAVILEYFQPGNVAFEGELNISKVTHGYRKVLDSPNLEKGFGSSGSCNNNVVCPEGLPWADQIRSVAVIVVNGNENCTGALVNNTCEDEKPYFLTADHCLGGSVSTWVFRFNWESPDCSPSVNGPYNFTISGATQHANNSGSDFALLELSSAPPSNYNVFYAGWDNSGTAPTNSIAIHHPSGDVKKISFDTDPATTASWGGADTWHISNWEDGTTEPGSSGSPLFNQDGLVIGQLFGGTANCSNNIDDYYGRFDVSWDAGGSANNQLVDWLDGCATNAVTIDGFDPNQPTAAIDANMLSIDSPENGLETCDGNITPAFTFKNKGTSDLTEVTVNYQIDNGITQSAVWLGTLTTNASDVLSFPQVNVSVGMHELKAWTSNPNQSTDMNSANDTASVTFEVISPIGQSLPLVEGFEGSTFPNANWSLENPDGVNPWEITNTVSGFGASNNAIRLDNFTDDFTGQRDGLVTPYLNFGPAVGGSITLEFNVAYAHYTAFYHDSVIVRISTDCGLSWDPIYAKGNVDLSTNGGASEGDFFVPTDSMWRTETIVLDNYAGLPHVKFMFENYSGYGNVVYLDDINISYEAPQIAPIANSSYESASLCEGGTIQFYDQTLYGPTSWNWNFPNASPSSSTDQNPVVSYSNGGTYLVELIASNAFGSDTTSATITIYDSPAIAATATDESSTGQSDGAIALAVTGGAAPYAYNWSNGETTSTLSDVTSGAYTVTVTDANGCSSVSLINIVVVGIEELTSNQLVRIYPNPSDGLFTIDRITSREIDATIEVYDILGALILSDNISQKQSSKTLDLRNYSKGFYVVNVMMGDYNHTEKLIIE